MNKKLLALAVAGAFAAPVAAMADSGNVTIYGQANVSYDLVDTGKAENQAAAPIAGVNSIRHSKVTSNSSRLGFKGNEDLGNGLSAVWQIESSINLDNAAGGTLAARNSFVGLSGKSWGTILGGKHDTPYKIATRSLDNFADGVADNRSIMGKAGTFDTRANNTVAYVSPSMSGFSVAAAYAVGENATANSVLAGGTATDNKETRAYSLSGNYSNGPLLVALAYQRHNNGGNAAATGGTLKTEGTEEHAWKIGAGYNFGAFDIGAVYERLSDDLNKNNSVAAGNVTGCNNRANILGVVGSTRYTGSECSGNSAWHLTGKYTFGSNAVKLAYTKAGNTSVEDKTGAKQWSVGFDHSFSKRTVAYALYTKLDNDQNAGYVLGGATSDAGAYAPSTNNVNSVWGADSSAWSFGLKHSF